MSATEARDGFPLAIGARGEVDVFGTWVGFEVAREPLFDPTGSRIRA